MDNDPIRVVAFDCADAGTLAVIPRCHCGKYLKHGQVFLNGFDMPILKNWMCHTHGEVKPTYEFVDPNDLYPVSEK